MKDIDPTRKKRQVLCIGVSVASRLSGLEELTASTEMKMVNELWTGVEGFDEHEIVNESKNKIVT